MEQKPTGFFWIIVLLTVTLLIGFSIQRSGVLTQGTPGTPGGEGAPGTSAPAPANLLEVSFYSSSAKKAWVDRMVKEFNQSRPEVSGKIVQVKAYHVESGSSLDQLKEGKIKPDLWSPGDESWLQLAASYWKSVKQKTLFDTQVPLVNIPLVIAMWEPMARALGHPKPIGWSDIEALATNPQGWAAFGHPEWGKFRWGHAHPDANSGFLALVSEVYAALGKTDQISVQDLKSEKVVSFVKGFEEAVEHYGLSNSWIDDLMHNKGPSYLSCAVQYENTIIESNEKNQNKPFKLVAIYPKEGNFWTRHPVAVIKEEWMTPEKEEAAKKFLAFLLSQDSQTKAMQMGLRPIMKELELTAPFDDTHGVVAKVDSSKQFVVPEEGVLKRIRDLWEDLKVPATVVMIIDRSGSMKGAPLDNAKIGAVEFVKTMKPRDKLMVVIFSNTVNVLTELGTIKDTGEQAIDKIQGIFSEGGTALHDVVSQNFELMKATMQKEPQRRYCILVLSDGQDTSSNMKKQDFLDTLPKGEQFDVPKIYTIAYGPEADKELLTEVANRTNARIFSSKPEDIMKTYKELSANF